MFFLDVVFSIVLKEENNTFYHKLLTILNINSGQN